MYVKDNQNQTGEMFPFIFELAEKMGLSENANDSNFQQPSSISSEAVEGEKNDHGGPLLKTMEGGGETNQGGTSSQPMDPMDVGESSQGGNSDEPMEGVESGQVDLRKLVDKEISNQVLSNSVLSLFKQKDHKIQMRIRL
jgi:hypothetical protein